MPRAPKKCARDGCEERVVAKPYCPRHQAEKQQRPPRQARGLGALHDKRVANLRKVATAEARPCWLCRERIDYTLRAPHRMSFAAHHLERDRLGPLVPTHKVCNERAGQPQR